MEGNILEGVLIQFNDLSEDMQEKLYLEDKVKFKREAAKSRYENIRKNVIDDKECDSETLDVAFKAETEIYGKIENIQIIWNHPNFQKNAEKYQTLADSDDYHIRIMVAENEGSSLELLNQMFRNEMKGKKSRRVIVAILENPNFKMSEETREEFAKSEDCETRMMAAKDEGSSSEFLNRMLRDEMQGERECDVIDAILENPNFQLQEDTRNLLAKSEEFGCRVKAAGYIGNSSEFLNEMLRNEIRKGGGDDDVINAILSNPNFKMEECTENQLANSIYWDNRLIAVRVGSKELLERMYLKETEKGILELIERNLLQEMKKDSVTLNIVQRSKIYKVLKELKHSRKRKSLLEYMEEILKIIG